MKQLTGTIIRIRDKVKNSVLLSSLYYIVILAGALAVFLFSSGEKVNYIYNQF